MISCKNCAQTFEGKYCSNCGQKASTKRFSTRILFSELVDKLLPLDRGVLQTAYQLVTRPGAMLLGYLEGKRAKFTKPLQFQLIMVAISLIFFPQDAFKRGMSDRIPATANPDQAANQVITTYIYEWVSANMTVLIVGMIPFMALAAVWIFRKRGLNFAEHAVVACYLSGGSTLIGLPLMFYTRFSGINAYSSEMSGLFGLVFIGYFVWGYVGLFRGYNAWITGLKTVAVVILGYMFYLLTAILLAGLAIKIYLLFGGKL